MGDRVRAMDPVAAFSLVGHEVRLGILEAVFEAGEDAVAFSTIRDAVCIRDPGRLNYHLTELHPHFLERTDEGYVLQRPGSVAVRLVRAGRLTDDGHLLESAVGDCLRCGGELVLAYDPSQFGVVACRDCRRWFVRWLLPPGALAGRDASGIATVLDERCRSARRLGNAGVCPLCTGPMSANLTQDDQFDHPAALSYACESCACEFDSTVGAALVGHPAVVAFHHDHGIDVTDRPLWELPVAFDPDLVSVLDSGPPRVELARTLAGDRLRCIVGEDGTVIQTAVEST